MFIIGTYSGYSQQSLRDSSIFLPHIDAYYSFAIPSNDLNDRFGYFHNVGAGFFIKDRHSWIYGADFGIQFGDQVKENTISNLVTSSGGVINTDGKFGAIKLSMRGITAIARFGRMIHVLAPNPNSGIVFMLGVGYWQHRIRVEDVQQKTPQIEGDYQKGYDRLTKGLCTSQFLGYQLFSNSRLFNFSVGIEFNQGFTKGVRKYNFSEFKADNSGRNDNYTAFKFYWAIPLFKKMPQDYYFD